MVIRTFGMALVAMTVAAQQAPQAFEIVSIRPNVTGSESRRASSAPGGAFVATNAGLRLLMSRAFGVPEAQIVRGPGWVDTEKYDVNARAAVPYEMTREQLRPCLQAMLAERFGLKFHRERKEGSVYSLVLAKNGPKFREHAGDGRSGISASTEQGKTNISGTKITMARLAEYLSGQADRRVIDNTGLTGEYDFVVEWSPDETVASAQPSIFAALQEQLGLRLVSTIGPIETIVIDDVDRPSEN